MSRGMVRWLVWGLLAACVAVGGWVYEKSKSTMEMGAVSGRNPEFPQEQGEPVSIYNYTQIDQLLTIGGRVDSPPEGTVAVLNLSLLKDDYSASEYKWAGIADASPAPSLEWLREQVDFVNDQIRAGHAVFVHCDAGISRSGLVAVAYEMRHRNMDLSQALALVREHRPIRPNAAFVDLLKDWQLNLQEHQ